MKRLVIFEFSNHLSKSPKPNKISLYETFLIIVFKTIYVLLFEEIFYILKSTPTLFSPPPDSSSKMSGTPDNPPLWT